MTMRQKVEELKNRHPRSHWVERISAAWSNQLEDIFQTGNLIEAAKAELPHGEYLKMVKDELPFSRSAASILMQIADNDNLRNGEHIHHLPVSWGTLYELTKLTDEQFDAAITNGMIHPKMTRKDAKALRGEPEPKPEKPPTEKCVASVRRAVMSTLKQIPPEEWKNLLRKLRATIDEIDEQELDDGHHAARKSA